MEAGLDGDNLVQRQRIGICDLLEEQRVEARSMAGVNRNLVACAPSRSNASWG